MGGIREDSGGISGGDFGDHQERSGVTRKARGIRGEGFGGSPGGPEESPKSTEILGGDSGGILGGIRGPQEGSGGARNAQGELGTLKREDDRRSEAELSGDGQERSGGGGSAERSGAIDGFFPLKNWFFPYENPGKSWKSS